MRYCGANSLRTSREATAVCHHAACAIPTPSSPWPKRVHRRASSPGRAQLKNGDVGGSQAALSPRFRRCTRPVRPGRSAAGVSSGAGAERLAVDAQWEARGPELPGLHWRRSWGEEASARGGAIQPRARGRVALGRLEARGTVAKIISVPDTWWTLAAA